MSAAYLVAVVIHFTGHLVVARPESPTAPTVVLAPKDLVHQPLLLIRTDDLVKFDALASTVLLKGSFTPSGEPAVEIDLTGWDVQIGHVEKPDIKPPATTSWAALTASKLAVSAAAKMSAKAGTTQKPPPVNVAARIVLKHPGTLAVMEPTEGFKEATWSCTPPSADCKYDKQALTDRLSWTANGTPTLVLVFESHGGLTPPYVEIAKDAQLWFVNRLLVSGAWPCSGAVSHVPNYGLSLDYDKLLPGIKLDPDRDIKPVFCPPIVAVRGH
jgi:hypothetical protein